MFDQQERDLTAKTASIWSLYWFWASRFW